MPYELARVGKRTSYRARRRLTPPRKLGREALNQDQSERGKAKFHEVKIQDKSKKNL